MKFHKWPIARDVREESAGDDGGRRREWTDPWRPGREGERVRVKERERERGRASGKREPGRVLYRPDHVDCLLGENPQRLEKDRRCRSFANPYLEQLIRRTPPIPLEIRGSLTFPVT